MELLKTIDSPADLRQLDAGQLPQLAAELRAYILDTVTTHGGHLSSNLGTVELAVALHYVLDTPRDPIVWDVGHQAYAHKVLTGRRDQLPRVRRRGGISGFPQRDESAHDAFGTAHASTSISAAFGMAAGGCPGRAVAVIGDGALSGGMAFEALNCAGARPDIDLLVVLNDNDMSISPAVGALRQSLARILASNFYSEVKRGSDQVMPPGIREFLSRAEGRLRGMVMPGTLFEELGFSYFGPIDGHDVDALTTTLTALKDRGGPRLLHVATVKGKGFAAAERDPVKHHAAAGAKAPNKVEKAPPPARPTYSAVFGEWICAAAAADKRVHAVTPAMREGSGLVEFAARFPERYFDCGIAEQHAVTFSAGLACAGQKPVLAIYSTFLQRGYDQLIHDVAIQKLPVLFAVDRAGLVGADGATHQGAFDLSYARCVPNLTVMVPADERECWLMLNTGLALDGPALVRYPRGSGPGTEPPADVKETLEVGKAEVRRTGEALAILAFGPMVEAAAPAAEELNATLVNMRFAKPLDLELLRELALTHSHFLTVEENAVAGGAGSGVAEAMQRLKRRPALKHLGLPDRFINHGTPAEQREEAGLTPAAITAAARELAAADRRLHVG
ncbi:MAG: 1-deoxy-D-xylulose-5-phosphate synthase [Betaproteobacteria bacterium AqS2]|uniref:1-deoxy-D-xylulose-5-phosphate synthase n=1 Tax=Candidatus Amphirhobacter heronislandensis TaxID=1732024 RepID=A0A930XXB3_9GAMM|nr:1-deoxy-D-xylulose-5-phosphate synthase [Betaproteobacteria bacterium AqS2]